MFDPQGFRARALRRILVLGSCALVGGASACSENFGPAPPDGGRRVDVVDEHFTGPVVSRAVLGVSDAGGRVRLATDAGLYGVDVLGDSFVWRPVHGGFTTVEGGRRVGSVEHVAADPDGNLWIYVGRLGPVDALTLSLDGGATHVRLDLPDPTLSSVTAVGVVPPGDAWPVGAFAVVQGARLYLRSVDAEAGWTPVELPSSPSVVGRIRALPDGRLAMSVRESGSWTVWIRAAGAPSFERTSVAATGEIFDLTLFASGFAWVDAAGVATAAGGRTLWPGSVRAARLERDGVRWRWSVLGDLDDGSVGFATGVGDSVQFEIRPSTLAESVVGVVRLGGSEWAVTPAADLVRLDGSARRLADTRELDWSAIATVSGSRIALGRLRNGEVFEGPVDDPDAIASLGTPPLASTTGALLAGVGTAEGWFAGSFGVHFADRALSLWQTRSDGQFSYDPTLFGGPVGVTALAYAGGWLWLGALNGDGPYRSSDQGGLWERVHDGLGVPGSFRQEFGLPGITQVRAFVEDSRGAVWMAGFRGGVFRLGENDVWENHVRGLPDLTGATVDSCCSEPGVREVDVRDLIALEDGALLAATGYGVHLYDPDRDLWTERSLGIRNRDVRALAQNPQRPEEIVAGCSGRGGSPDWLYFTADAGATWFPVDTALVAKNCTDLVWSGRRPHEVTALLEAEGAWSLELAP